MWLLEDIILPLVQLFLKDWSIDLCPYQAKRASSRQEVLHTDFLTPPILKESMVVLEKLTDVKAVAQGGYPQVQLI